MPPPQARVLSSLQSYWLLLFWPEFLSPARLQAAWNISGTHCRVHRSGRGRSFTRRGRSLYGRSGAHFLARLAELLDLVQTLLLLVNPHGEELDDGLGHAQAALQLVDDSPPAFDRQQKVNAIVKASHGVCQAAFTHALYALDGAPGSGDSRLQRGNQFVQIVVQHVGPNDEHQFISTIHSLSPNSATDFSGIIPEKSRKSQMGCSPG